MSLYLNKTKRTLWLCLWDNMISYSTNETIIGAWKISQNVDFILSIAAELGYGRKINPKRLIARHEVLPTLFMMAKGAIYIPCLKFGAWKTYPDYDQKVEKVYPEGWHTSPCSLYIWRYPRFMWRKICAQLLNLLCDFCSLDTACMSTKMTFKELFDHLAIFISNPEVRWKQVMRVKRVLADCNGHGGYGNDQIYFTGEFQNWV